PTPRATPPGPSIRYADFSSTAGLTLNGSARQAGSALRLTGNQYDVAGSAWSRTTIGAGRSFSATFRVLLHDAAEGIAFLVQAEGPSALGDSASYLGYGDYYSDQRIRPSVAVELDVCDDSGDPNWNHVGIVSNGNVSSHLAHGQPRFDMAAGTAFTVWVDYDAAQHRLTVYVSTGRTKPTSAVTSAGVDLAARFGTRPVYVGFTGATSEYTAAQDVLSWSLTTS
ncbi:L-type lectin-domain containing protein, partial [Micromonospora echinofusca]